MKKLKYKIIEGRKEYFENEISRLYEKGYVIIQDTYKVKNIMIGKSDYNSYSIIMVFIKTK